MITRGLWVWRFGGRLPVVDETGATANRRARRRRSNLKLETSELIWHEQLNAD